VVKVLVSISTTLKYTYALGREGHKFWVASLLLTDLGQIFEELGDGRRVLLDRGRLLPLLDQNL
jgi:hypothetical protein